MKRHGKIVEPTKTLGAVFNPAVIKHDNGRYIMLVRTVPKGYAKLEEHKFDDSYTSILSQWESTSPDTGFKMTNPNAIGPNHSSDKFGCEDPSIIKVGDKYCIFYTVLADGKKMHTREGRIAMATTRDFKTFKKLGVIGPDCNSKAAALFESSGKLHFVWKDDTAEIERIMMSPAPDNFEKNRAASA